MALWLLDMYLWFEFSPKAARLFVRVQGLDSPERLRVLTDKNVDDICNVIRKPGGKIFNRMPNKRATGFSHIPREPETSYLPIPS